MTFGRWPLLDEIKPGARILLAGAGVYRLALSLLFLALGDFFLLVHTSSISKLYKKQHPSLETRVWDTC